MVDDFSLQQLKQGSVEAFAELVRQYGRRLYSVSLRMLRNPQDAEDAVQEAFLKAHLSLNSFREESSLYTWLYRIVSNEALSRLRKRAKRQLLPLEEYLPHFEHGQHVEAIQDWSQLPDSELETKELKDFFEKCVDELPEDYRIAYVLKDMEGLPERDVCRITGTSRAAMKNRVHRARLILRGRIEKHFFPHEKKGSPSVI